MNKSERFWDISAKRFNNRVDPNDRMATSTLDHTRKYLHSNAFVLDLGCAAGKYTLEIAPYVKEIWGIDISTEMIKTAKMNALGSNCSNVHFLRTDISGSQLKDKTFNVILAFNILHLVEDPGQALISIKKLLQPDGVVISVTPCLGTGGSVQEMLIKCGSRLGIIPEVHAFKPNEVEALLLNAQFEPVESHILSDHMPVVFIAASRRF